MGDSTWGKKDCPWWYNERASISQLAGAIWLAGGWAFEEFSETKRSPEEMDFPGRVDLMFWTGREKNGPQFVAEAKSCWLRLRSKYTVETINHSFNCAIRDSQKVKTYKGRYTKLAIVFIAPLIPVKYHAETKQRLDALIGTMKSRPRTYLAWYFRVAEDTPVHNGYFYPGVMLGVQPIGPE
ncbi:hypothetical protein [Corallococcus sp. AS-1-12]|uniref:hypothetical protein n=1 Tax=Corallococcus sp. AS-1-12 TaxID=2874598 RepID=UPI001CBCF6A5|nr:hypothetical protein [Corallococcus sp. AS-1-12]MBZ4336701.1 hypothetical protein [Corallococcus sp. AS-1-12]